MLSFNVFGLATVVPSFGGAQEYPPPSSAAAFASGAAAANGGGGRLLREVGGQHRQEARAADDGVAAAAANRDRSLGAHHTSFLSDPVCARVCAVSAPHATNSDGADDNGPVGTVPAGGHRLPTRFCAGSLRLAPCCQCVDEGFKPEGTAQHAFLHVCIPTSPREYLGHDQGFLQIVLSALEAQIRDQATSGTFAGVRACACVCVRINRVCLFCGRCCAGRITGAHLRADRQEDLVALSREQPSHQWWPSLTHSLTTHSVPSHALVPCRNTRSRASPL